MMLKNLIKDASIYGLSDFVFKAISFLTFPIYAYLFTLEEFSTMSLVVTLVCLMNLFFNLGNINNAVQRFYWDCKDLKKVVVSTALACLIIISIALGIFLFMLIWIFKSSWMQGFGVNTSVLLYAFLGGIFNNILAFSMNVIRLYFTPWKFFLLSIGSSALTVISSIFFVMILKLGVEGYFLAILLANLALMPLGLWLIKNDLGYVFDISLAKEMIHFSYPFLLMGMIYWAIASLDRWMLFKLADLDQVGLYAISFRFATIVNLFATAFGQAFSPQALKIYSESSSMFSLFIQKSFIFLTLILIGIWSCLSLFAHEFLYLMTPEPYWGAYDSLIYICLGTAILGISQITAFPITLAKKTYIFNYALILSLLFNILLNWLWIPSDGAVGAAVASACSYFILTVSYWGFSQFLPTRFSLDFKFIGAITIYVLIALLILKTNYFQTLSLESFFAKIGFIICFGIFCLITLRRYNILSFNLALGEPDHESFTPTR